MRRIHLTVEYDGTDYAGWQRQSNAMTVQEQLERAVKRLTGETVCVSGASRTDAGVHALGQSAHFDTESRIPADKFSLCAQYAFAAGYSRGAIGGGIRRISCALFRTRQALSLPDPRRAACGRAGSATRTRM